MQATLHYRLLVAQTVFRREVLAEVGRTCPELSPGQPKVIDFLMDTPKATQCDIAEACLIKPPTLTGILAKMEDAGLVLRERRENDRRKLLVSLTPKGRETGAKVLEAFARVEARALEGFAGEEGPDLVSVLRRIQANLLRENNHAKA